MSRTQRLIVSCAVALLAMLTFGAWALSSPVGATPDEDFHLASIWCGSGERDGLCEAGSAPEKRAIPDKIADSICYAHNDGKSAACQGDDFLDAGFGLVDSKRVNAGTQYPSGFYFWSSFLASDNLALSTIALRFAHAAFFSVLAIALWLVLPRANRPGLLGGIAITFVPLGLFLIPSVNPSGWAIASGALLLPALLGYFAAEGWRRWVLAGFAVIAALLALGSRGDSAAYTVVAALAALALAFEASRAFWLRALLPAAIIVAAAVAFLGAGQTGLALGGMTATGFERLDPARLLLENVLALPELFAGVLGQSFDNTEYTGLGWLDTPLPAAVWGLTTLVFAGVVFIAFKRIDWRRGLALAGVALAAAVIPLYILGTSHVVVGWQVQPRYIMPLITMFAIVALSPSGGGRGSGGPETLPGVAGSFSGQGLRILPPRFTRFQYWVVAALLTIANAVALFANMRRYTSPGNFNLNEGDWWWNAGPSPMATLAIGVLAFGALAVLLAETAWRSRNRQEVAA